MKTRLRILLLMLVLLGGVQQAFAPIPAALLQVFIYPGAAVAAGAQW
jgi:hypothetical protein